MLQCNMELGVAWVSFPHVPSDAQYQPETGSRRTASTAIFYSALRAE